MSLLVKALSERVYASLVSVYENLRPFFTLFLDVMKPRQKLLPLLAPCDVLVLDHVVMVEIRVLPYS